MPLFFFLSGYCFKEYYLNDFKLFIKKKALGYYKPFLIWVIIFCLLHNLLYEMNLYSNEYSLNEILSHIGNAFLFKYDEPMVGGFWFLREIFCANLIAWFGIFGMGRVVKLLKLSDIIIYSIIISITLLTAFILSYSNFDNWTVSFLGASYVMTGYIFKIKNITIKKTTGIVVLAVSVVLSLLLEYDLSMLASSGKRTIASYFIAMIGIVGVFTLCTSLGKYLNTFFEYIGNRTMDIFTFHFLSFKLVSFIIVTYLGEEWIRISEHPYVQGVEGQHWIAYLIVGILGSLMIASLIESLKKIVFQKIKSYRKVIATSR